MAACLAEGEEADPREPGAGLGVGSRERGRRARGRARVDSLGRHRTQEVGIRSTNTVADGPGRGCYLDGRWSSSKPRDARLKMLASSRC